MAKRIPYKITDLDALQKAFPEVVKEETVPETIIKVPNKELLYKIVKLHHGLNRAIPGVEIGESEKDDGETTSDNAPSPEPIPEPEPTPEPELQSPINQPEGEGKPPAFLARHHQQKKGA